MYATSLGCITVLPWTVTSFCCQATLSCMTSCFLLREAKDRNSQYRRQSPQMTICSDAYEASAWSSLTWRALSKWAASVLLNIPGLYCTCAPCPRSVTPFLPSCACLCVALPGDCFCCCSAPRDAVCLADFAALGCPVLEDASILRLPPRLPASLSCCQRVVLLAADCLSCPAAMLACSISLGCLGLSNAIIAASLVAGCECKHRLCP